MSQSTTASVQFHIARLTTFVVAIALIGSDFAIAADQPITDDDQRQKATVKLDYNLTDGDLEKFTPTLQGLTKPRKFSKLTAKVTGGIAKIYVQEGDVVPLGTPLVQIDDKAAVAAVKVAEIKANQVAAIQRCQLDLQIEDARLKRLQSVVSSNATSNLELWEKTASRDQKKAILDEATEASQFAKAQLKAAQIDLGLHKISAPFNGQIIEINQKVGSAPQPGDPVITIADLSELEVEMHLPLSKFGKIHAGDRLNLIAQQPVNRTIAAKVISVSPLINPTSNTFRCLFVIDNADKSLPAGFAVTLESK